MTGGRQIKSERDKAKSHQNRGLESQDGGRCTKRKLRDKGPGGTQGSRTRFLSILATTLAKSMTGQRREQGEFRIRVIKRGERRYKRAAGVISDVATRGSGRSNAVRLCE